MISKELLSSVIRYKVQEIIGMLAHTMNKSTLAYICKDISLNDGKRIINMYELAHRCKEWALSKECQLLSCIKVERSLCDIYSNVIDCKFTHYEDTEPEAIFKACEYILKEKQNG